MTDASALAVRVVNVKRFTGLNSLSRQSMSDAVDFVYNR